MDSGFHIRGFRDTKVAGFQILFSNVSLVLRFPNEMTPITGLLLNGKNKYKFSFFTRKLKKLGFYKII